MIGAGPFPRCPLTVSGGERHLRLTFPAPPTKTEQVAIATILSDMDTEIIALEGEVTKSRQLKQGMMQELLTGRKRLI